VSPRCHRGVLPLDLPGGRNHGVGRGSRTHTSWGTTRRPTVGPSSQGYVYKCLKTVRPAGLEPAHSVSETDAATDDWATDAKIAAKGVAPDVQGYEPQLSTRTAAMGESTRPRSRTGSFSLGPSWSSRQPRRVCEERQREQCARGDSNPQSQVLSLVSLPVRLRARGRGGGGRTRRALRMRQRRPWDHHDGETRVSVRGFAPPAFCSRSRRSTRLSYTLMVREAGLAPAASGPPSRRSTD
jgi:hypothetical protein